MSAVLALTASLASMHLMARHRHYEVRCSQLLEESERNEGFADIREELQKGAASGSSYMVWMFMLGVFATAAALIIVGVLLHWEWVPGVTS